MTIIGSVWLVIQIGPLRLKSGDCVCQALPLLLDTIATDDSGWEKTGIACIPPALPEHPHNPHQCQPIDSLLWKPTHPKYKLRLVWFAMTGSHSILKSWTFVDPASFAQKVLPSYPLASKLLIFQNPKSQEGHLWPLGIGNCPVTPSPHSTAQTLLSSPTITACLALP